jgi:hypothetical protein
MGHDKAGKGQAIIISLRAIGFLLLSSNENKLGLVSAKASSLT